MYSQELFRSFLRQRDIEAPFQVWIANPVFPNNLILVDGDNWYSRVPTKLSFFERPIIQKTDNHMTYLYFEFPDHYQMIVCLLQKVEMTEEDLQMIRYLIYPCYADSVIEASNYKLDRMVDSIRHTTSSLDLEELFASILSNALDVIPNADLGTLWQYDPQIERLVCKTSVGNVLKGVTNMKFHIHEGLVGYTFRLGKPKLFTNLADMPIEQMTDLTEENKEYWDFNYDFMNNVKSMLTVPITVDETTECLMILCQIKTPYSLTEQDLYLLQGFSSQVGIAMRNARLFTDLKKHNQLLLSRDHIHSTLTKLSIQSMGATKVIHELKRMIGQPLIFVDFLESKCIPPSKQMPTEESFDDLLNYLTTIKKKGYYSFDEADEHKHYLYPIHVGSVFLGCIIIKTDSQLSQIDQIALEQAEAVLTLELVKKQNLIEYYFKQKRELYHDFLQTKDSSELLKKAGELGISGNDNFAAVIFQFLNDKDPHMLEASIHRFISYLKQQLSPYIQIIFGYHNKITLLAHFSSSADAASFKKQLERYLTESKKEKGLHVSAGMGSVQVGIEVIWKSHQEAEKALSYLVTKQLSGLIGYFEIGVNRLFINQDQEEIKSFLNEVFKPLRETQSVNVPLEQTLLTYFTENRSATNTAKAMHIHINTLYQRLRKIEDCLDLSLDNAEHVLRLQLACFLKESYE